jgi:FADH2 O2-dependent halogenase
MQGKYDIVVIGVGPAGCAWGSYLAKAKVSCAIFEKSIFPRPHVGESLVPDANRVLTEIGGINKMETQAIQGSAVSPGQPMGAGSIVTTLRTSHPTARST